MENKDIFVEHNINSKRVAKNTLVLYLRMLLTIFVGLYTSRIVLEALGVIDFGLYGVVGGIVVMLGFINNNMASASQRFITFALGGGKQIELEKVFSTSLLVHWLTALLILLLSETVGLWAIFHLMTIPEDRMTACIWVYQCAIVSTIISVTSVPYNALIIAEERMSAFAYISIIESLLKLLIAYFLMIGHTDRLVTYALLLLLTQVAIRYCYTSYCKRNFPVSNCRYVFDKGTLFNMVKFSAWSLNGTLALAGASQGIDLLLNIYFGPAINAARSISVQIQSKVIGFSNNFQNAISPQITKAYAVTDYNNLYQLLIWGTKLGFFLFILFALPIIANVSYILHIWLTVVPDYTEEFVSIMLLSSMVRSMATPLITAIHATGDLKRFQLWEGSILLLVVPVAFILLEYGHVNPIVVICVYFISELIAQFTRIWIILPKIMMRYSAYARHVLFPIFLIAITLSLLMWFVNRIQYESAFFTFVIRTVLCIIGTAIASYFIGCNTSERKIIKQSVNALFNKLYRRWESPL